MQWTIDLVVDRGLSVLGSFPEARDRQLGIGSNRRNCVRGVMSGPFSVWLNWMLLALGFGCIRCSWVSRLLRGCYAASQRH